MSDYSFSFNTKRGYFGFVAQDYNQTTQVFKRQFVYKQPLNTDENPKLVMFRDLASPEDIPQKLEVLKSINDTYEMIGIIVMDNETIDITNTSTVASIFIIIRIDSAIMYKCIGDEVNTHSLTFF